MERKYRCHVDNGHERFAFDFWSSHRLGSKANKEDAKAEWKSRGHRQWNLDILWIDLNYEEGQLLM